jgi:DNA-directed RNA polymerase specialized sigma54-like protein
MEIPSLAQLKKDLSYLSEKELIDLITDLAKFSRDNKAFLHFKLNERDQPNLFVDAVKEELDNAFLSANNRSYHIAKKSVQGIRRKLNKSLKLSKNKADQAELILYFCEQMKENGYLRHGHPVIDNLFRAQIGKAQKLIASLHEDLQSDFSYRIEDLQ